jgi:hypothetical protein
LFVLVSVYGPGFGRGLNAALWSGGTNQACKGSIHVHSDLRRGQNYATDGRQGTASPSCLRYSPLIMREQGRNVCGKANMHACRYKNFSMH